MADDPYVHLEVALERDCSDTIRGTVCAPGGAATPFTGWLELMSMFDGARSRGCGERGPEDSGRRSR